MNHKIIGVDQWIGTLLYESEAVCFFKGKQLLIIKKDPNQVDSEIVAKLRKCLDNVESNDDST